MAIGREAEQVKREMMTVVTLRRELEALEKEWHDLLAALEESVDDTAASGFAVAEGVNRERMALRRRLAQQQLRNWARIHTVGLTPLQKRILGLRFVQGCTWGDITARLKKAKQYLLREHNKALAKLAQAGFEKPQKKL